MRRGRSKRFNKIGIRKVDVPNLSGLSRTQAKTLLESIGLTWSETPSTVQNINLDQAVADQSVSSGSVVKIGETISFNYYVYVAPPPAPPVAPPSAPPSTPPSGPPSGPSVPVCGECTGYVVMQPTCNGEDVYQGYYSAYSRACYDQYGAYSESTAGCPTGGIFQYYGNLITANASSCGGSGSTPPTSPPAAPPATPPSSPPSGCTPFTLVSEGACQYNSIFGACVRYNTYYNSDCTTYGDFVSCSGCSQPNVPPVAPPSAPPSTPPADPPIYAPPSTPPIDLPPLGPPAAKSVGVSTLIRTPSGLVRAENLNVGDVLLSADLEGFPYNPGVGVTEEALSWTSENPNINFVNTTIVGIRRRIGDKAIIINGDIFSQYHWILVKRDNVVRFVLSEEIVENSDYIFDPETNTWEIVDLFEAIQVNHETISIDCEPYDMFFTDKMLTHDSFSI